MSRRVPRVTSGGPTGDDQVPAGSEAADGSPAPQPAVATAEPVTTQLRIEIPAHTPTQIPVQYLPPLVYSPPYGQPVLGAPYPANWPYPAPPLTPSRATRVTVLALAITLAVSVFGVGILTT